ncbi:hypothetical protein P9272_18310 [Mesorhizobium sp. WSM4976]|uniref:hypothetical protein n=1 Tax=Mesorhizobium sp. WSM4976 TaxID=3038549 RepID=UPI002417AD5A|nr:hypothetical protein [Mesorhizobium sp. WSM4976]MDG4895526.1 hypothetical protein [Mesorhizobium sp. WSM4976]
MAEIATVLQKLLADNPGPVSIAAGMAALRAIGMDETDGDLQSTVGTFAAERGRAIRFDRWATRAPLNNPVKGGKITPNAL